MRSKTLLAVGVMLAPIAGARAETVEVYSAGSLRAAVTELVEAVKDAYGIDLKPTFGGSGLLRERIEKGEKPDLFLSADVGSPRALATQRRTQVPVIAIARNRMCVVSAPGLALTEDTLADVLLAPATRLRTSTPIADPAGDYAWAIFDRLEATRPGAAATLKAKAQGFSAPAATPPPAPAAAPANPVVALFAARQVDVAITYCSGAPALQKELPGLGILPVPASLDPHPLYGMAVLSAAPAAQRVALFLLSEAGQALIARAGLVPIGPTAGSPP